jgi:hypothetical protein
VNANMNMTQLFMKVKEGTAAQAQRHQPTFHNGKFRGVIRPMSTKTFEARIQDGACVDDVETGS